MTTRTARIDEQRFGPWAVVTGASSGIGAAFARHLAANHINLVLAARRLPLLDQLGTQLSAQHGISYRAVRVDLSRPDFLPILTQATDDLDVGLLVSNAGDMVLGEFLDSHSDALLDELRLNTAAHLQLTHHFGQILTARGRGGIILVSSMAAAQGVPYAANYAAAKSYLLNLGEAVHRELARRGVNLTVLLPGATDTDMIKRFGADQTPMGRMAMPANTCVRHAFTALHAGRPTRVSGRLNRATLALTPRAARIRLFGAMNRSMAQRTAVTG
jgi:short-subunit dehydrogenase